MNQSNGEQVRTFVHTRISRFAKTSNQSLAATLARLRRGIGKEPGSQPDLWEVTLDELPESLQGTDATPSFGERAVHTALTLFSLHQQGKDINEKCMSESGSTLGGAVRDMIRQNPDREEAIKRRFMVAVTADSYEELAWHLRGLVQLLRSEEVRLDYPNLAKDLFYYQFPGNRDRIRLKWGRHFYWQPSQERVDQNSGDN